MNETVRQVLSVTSFAMLMTSITILALLAEMVKGVPRWVQTLAATTAFGIQALSVNSLIVDPRFGITLEHAFAVAAAANLIALSATLLADRHPVMVS